MKTYEMNLSLYNRDVLKATRATQSLHDWFKIELHEDTFIITPELDVLGDETFDYEFTSYQVADFRDRIIAGDTPHRALEFISSKSHLVTNEVA